MQARIPVVFVTVVVAVVLVLFAYDHFIVAPRMQAYSETERVGLDHARSEAAQIADSLEASVDRSVSEAQQAMDAQAAEVDSRRAADAQRQQEEIARYRDAAQAADVLSRAQMLKVALAEYRMSTGEWPGDLAAAGLGAPTDYAGGAVAAIDLEPNGVIAVHLRDDVARGGVVRLTPKASPVGMIEWTCRASDYPAMAAVEACRS